MAGVAHHTGRPSPASRAIVSLGRRVGDGARGDSGAVAPVTRSAVAAATALNREAIPERHGAALSPSPPW